MQKNYLFLILFLSFLISCKRDPISYSKYDTQNVYYNVIEGNKSTIMKTSVFLGESSICIEGAKLVSFLPRHNKMCYIKNSKAYFSNIDGSNAILISKENEKVTNAIISKNGEKIAYVDATNPANCSLCVYDVKLNEFKEVFYGIDDSGCLQFSPGGQQLIFASGAYSDSNPAMAIQRYDFRKKYFTILVKNGFDSKNYRGNIDWSSNNSYIGAIEFSTNDERITLYNANGYIQERLESSYIENFFFPVFSPDSDKILYIKSNPRTKTSTLKTSTVDDRNQRERVKFDKMITGDTYVTPTWSEDGYSIAYYNEKLDGNKSICIFSLREFKTTNEIKISLNSNQKLGRQLYWDKN